MASARRRRSGDGARPGQVGRVGRPVGRAHRHPHQLPGASAGLRCRPQGRAYVLQDSRELGLGVAGPVSLGEEVSDPTAA
jgi:hypothetical protein